MRHRTTSCHGLRAALIASAIVLSLTSGRTVVATQQSDNPDISRHERPDSCQQALQANGNAAGLHRQCDATGGGAGVAKGDFNGDGIGDLAIGVPYEDQNGIGAVGGVNVIYGSDNGLTSTADQFIDGTTFGLPYVSGDHVGWALAAGDFNGDGNSDLAVGAPDVDVNGVADAGRVLIINGSSSGLRSDTARGLAPISGVRGNFGEALVWADFNGDGFGDLAVGIPGVNVDLCFPPQRDAGEVQIFYGGTNGLSSQGAQRVRRASSLCLQESGVLYIGTGLVESGDGERFGSTLAAGNFNGDMLSGNPVFDLVIGLPLAAGARGAVQIVPGGRTGLRVTGAQYVDQDSPGVGGGAERDDQFGRALAVGDFNADLHDDLAIGVPFEDLTDNTAADAGAVHVLFGSFVSGEMVTAEGSLFISQAALAGVAVEAGDRFGWSLAAGRFDDDFRDDLAIGVPGEAIGSVTRAGIVQVLYGSSSGPSLTRVQIWHQNRANVPDSAESGDQFGYALSAWNYGKSTHADLAVGVPFEDLASAATGTQQVDAGAVILIYGAVSGLEATTSTPAELWHQDVSGVNDTAQPGDRFGNALY